MRICPVCKRSWAEDFRICPIDGLPLQEAASAASDPFIGKSVGNCRVVEKVADGELGPVYKAEDPVRGVVALQIVPAERTASPVLLEAFSDAVKLAAQLNHPHAVRVFGLESLPDGATAVFLEFFQSVTLQQYRQNNPGMSPADACGFVRQAAEGVMAAHRISMLHGALHPTRVFVAPDGKVKVAGFHRSGLREGGDVFTATPVTLPYLSPEQVGVVRDIAPDYRTDVYALGVILYELLSNRLPYEAKTPQDLATIMEGAPPLPPNFANPHVSPLLSRVVMRALSKHPTERQGSVEELIRELDASGQPAREPQRPLARYEPQYPPAKEEGSGLFAPSAPSQDSSLFSPPASAPRQETRENLWPEPAQEKSGTGEESVFGWFKTRVGPRSGSSRGGASKPALDDSSFGDRPPVRRREEQLEERTVVVSGGERRRKSFADTFAGFGRRDMDMTGTGALPKRRFSSKFYLGLGIGAVLLLSALFVVLYFGTTSATGKLMVDSTPPGAQVYINGEFRGNTPLPYTELKTGVYRLRVQLDGYEAKEENVEITARADIQRPYILVRQASLISPPVSPPPETPVIPLPPVTPATPVKLPPFANMVNAALRSRNFFPPSPENAFDILQRWQQAPGEEGTPALDQARQSFCREIEALGNERLDQKDFAGTRALLDQLRGHSPVANCAAGLQSAYEKSVSSSLGDLRISARAAMDRQNYVTPDSDNALRFVRLMLAIDPQEAEARSLDGEILNRALDQAKAKSSARQHQDALDIYLQVKERYPNAPIGTAALDQAIEREIQKLALLKSMNVSLSVQVKHGHGRKWVLFGASECTGILRIDGFGIKYTTSGEHPFQLSYDGLNSVVVLKDKVTIQGVGVPEGKIELQAGDASAAQRFSELSAKIVEYRRLYAEYQK